MILKHKTLAGLVAGLLIFSGSSPGFAHQQKTAFVEVLFNARSGRIEISQRFNLHDAEHAAQQLFGSGADILDSETTQTAFYQYATENFSVYRLDDSEIELENIGFELEGLYFWAYQIAPLESNLEALNISSSALHDLWPDQINWVNVKQDGEVQTAVFESGGNRIQIEIPEDSAI